MSEDQKPAANGPIGAKEGISIALSVVFGGIGFLLGGIIGAVLGAIFGYLLLELLLGAILIASVFIGYLYYQYSSVEHPDPDANYALCVLNQTEGSVSGVLLNSKYMSIFSDIEDNGKIKFKLKSGESIILKSDSGSKKIFRRIEIVRLDDSAGTYKFNKDISENSTLYIKDNKKASLKTDWRCLESPNFDEN